MRVETRPARWLALAALLAALALLSQAALARPLRPGLLRKLQQLGNSAPVIPDWCTDYTHSNVSVPEFPRDLGRHPESATEYWWYGGTIETPSGRKFGIELNFLLWNPTHCDGTMPFVANSLLVVSDVQNNRLLNRSTVQFQDPSKGVRFSSEPYEVQLDRDWFARQLQPGAHNWDQLQLVVVPGKKFPGGSDSEDMGLKLRLQVRPPYNILNGRNGFEVDDDRKTPAGEPIGSLHVSQPRIEVSPGSQILIAGETIPVSAGSLWLQHMWLSSAETPREMLAYWNWFHFVISDGWNLEITYFRHEDGRPTAYPNGNLISPNGEDNFHFGIEAITVKESREWRSPKSGHLYLIHHEIIVDIPGHRLEISTKPLIDDNEVLDPLGLPNCYYEGATAGSGTHNGQRISTRGFSEIIGKYMCEF